MSEYLRTDEQLDVLVSLREFERQLDRVPTDTHAWKFAITSLMFAVNGSLVCFLSGTMQTGALSKENAKATIAKLNAGDVEEMPDPFLANPIDLLKRAAGRCKRYDTRNELLHMTDEQEKSFKKLVGFRNQFTHFSPQGWSIELSGLPRHCRNCIGIIELIHQDGWAFRHLAKVSHKAVSNILAQTSKKLSALDQSEMSR